MLNLTQVDRLTDAQLVDLHRLYQGEWWTKARSLEQARRIVEHSDLIVGLCQGEGGRLVAFARVLTDFTIKAIIFDVIVDDEFRGNGLGQALLDAIVGHPRLRQVLNLELFCRPELMPFYQRWGFVDKLPELRLMRLTRAAEQPTGP